ncbi:HlyD family secretion protein [Pseudomonas nicosulfuronedens]|uniref:HlyD family secretion protein n=1 Tax=Pseudomonas nicosulfuronedens TaxID=2571105 RepID=A0A5R9QTS9_9PSED|nr:HlyD family secretion protein [Pseudomonas nicosulfuronedens]MDH1012599.1 HlyD family secretion protein [Pseudomonas nicosulfuronedens]MDH1982297.1 HlyD family secretion protein [Pseudomonas nicosulfuronedens]MDH2029442.1 HlyD family secretion protein [Pseudomonas nicosulfuronedens]TLX73141.1 HlyD family secretion protein [Pseudomonas nicosulfuronedens]
MNQSVTLPASPAVDTARPKSRKALKLAVATAALLGVGAYAGHWWLDGRFLEKTDDAYVGGDVTVISPRVAGYIAELKVSDNQLVHAGDLLARIDDRDYRAALAKAEGAVHAEEAALGNVDAQASLQDALIRQSQAEIDAATAEEVRTRDDQRRYATLVRTNAVSVEAAQRADASFKSARANSDKAHASLLAARRQLDVIHSQRQQALAALEQAVAARDLARLDLGYTELRAPVDGYIGNRRARVGSYVAAGTQLLAVVPAQGLWVDANFKEDQLARMQPGQAVTIEADILPGKVFHGHLDSLAPATGAQFSILPPENATGNFTKIVQRVPVRVHLDDADGRLGNLRPGLSVLVEVDTRAHEHGSADQRVAQDTRP